MTNKIEHTEVKDFYKSYFDKTDSQHLLLRAVQIKGREKFDEINFPNRKTEEWKYTNVSPILENNFTPALSQEVQTQDIKVEDYIFNEVDSHLLVFVDGIFNAELSDYEKEEGLIIGGLANEIDEHVEVLLPNISDIAKIDNPFHALNTSMISDGAVVCVADGKVVEKPVQVLFLSTGDDKKLLNVPRNLYLAGKNSQVKIINVFRSINDKDYFTNSVTEIVVDENASLELYKIQDESKKSYHIDKTEVKQEKHSNFKSFSMSFGGSIVRNDLNSVMKNENIETHFYGLYIGSEKQHIDNHTLADHAKPNCFSNEIYKGILKDESTGVFNGKIMVRPDAQQTNAFQSNKTIILSDKAKMDTKPQLEIFADDVKCSHGATVGSVDDSSLFYLRTRGISKIEAEKMLVKGFVSDVIDAFSIEELKEPVNELVIKNLNY